MNFIKKMETFLEEVDQQAASSLSRPGSTVLSKKKEGKEAVDELERLGVPTKDLGLDFDPELNLEATTIANTTQELEEKQVEPEEIIKEKDNTTEIKTEQSSEEPVQGSTPRRKEKQLISSLEIKLKTSKNQINTLESQQSEILSKYNELKTFFQKQKKQLVQALQSKLEAEESYSTLSDKTNELEDALQTKTQLFSNLQLRFKQKSDECELIKKESDEWKEKCENTAENEKETEKTLQHAQQGALLRIQELECELEHKQIKMEEFKENAKRKEGQLEQKIEDYSSSFETAQAEAEKQRSDNERILKDLEHHKRLRNTFEEQLKEFKALENVAIQDLNAQIARLSSRSDPTGEQSELVLRLTTEREQLVRQVSESEERIADLNSSIYEFEKQMNDSQQRLQESLNETNGLLVGEQQKLQTMQKEMAIRTKQLIAARDRNEQIEAMYRATLQEKDKEISQLTKKIRHKTSTEELEKQIQSLRDNIEKKQLQIDTLNSQNATMVHQLRHEERKRGTEIAVPYAEPKFVDDNAKFSERITPMMALAPSLAISDSFMARKFVSIARTLDKVAVRCQEAFRTHPALRLALLIYMILIHLWLLTFILFPSTSEPKFADLKINE